MKKRQPQKNMRQNIVEGSINVFYFYFYFMFIDVNIVMNVPTTYLYLSIKFYLNEE